MSPPTDDEIVDYVAMRLYVDDLFVLAGKWTDLKLADWQAVPYLQRTILETTARDLLRRIDGLRDGSYTYPYPDDDRSPST